MCYIYVPSEVYHVWAGCHNVYTKDELQQCKVNIQRYKCLESSASLSYHGTMANHPYFLNNSLSLEFFYCAKWRDGENKWEGLVNQSDYCLSSSNSSSIC